MEKQGREPWRARTEHGEGQADHLGGGGDPEEGRRPPERERAGRGDPQREPERQRLPDAHQRGPRAAAAGGCLRGHRRRIDQVDVGTQNSLFMLDDSYHKFQHLHAPLRQGS